MLWGVGEKGGGVYVSDGLVDGIIICGKVVGVMIWEATKVLGVQV